MADHKSRVVRIPPGAELDDREIGRRERPLDHVAIDAIGVHSRIVAAMADERLHRAVVNELSLTIRLGGQQWAVIAIGDHGGVTCAHLPHIVVSVNGVRG